MITKHKHDLSASKEFFYIGLSMLEQNGKTNMIPEMMQILSPHQVILMSQVFGGKSVKFPSAKELSLALKAALYVYYAEIERKPEADIVVLLGSTDHELKLIRDYKRRWEETVKTELGNDFYALIRGQHG